MTQVPRKLPSYAKLCNKNHRVCGINEIKGKTLKNLVAHKKICENLIKMVAQFYPCYMVKKYINTTIAKALFLKKAVKVACRSGHQKACNL